MIAIFCIYYFMFTFMLPRTVIILQHLLSTSFNSQFHNKSSSLNCLMWFLFAGWWQLIDNLWTSIMSLGEESSRHHEDKMLNSVYTMSCAKLNKKLFVEMMSNDIRARKYRKITFVCISLQRKLLRSYQCMSWWLPIYLVVYDYRGLRRIKTKG